MEFNEEEVNEIKGAAKNSEAIRKLWDDYCLSREDAGAKFYKNLLDTVGSLGAELDSVRSGTYSKRRILECDTKTWSRIFALLSNSKKIREGLSFSMESDYTKPQKKVSGKAVDEDDISITDDFANKKNKK